MKKLCAMALSILLLVSSGATALAATTGEPDYSSWSSTGVYPQDIVNTIYFESVSSLMNVGAITGDSDGNFYPEKTINRAEFAAIVIRASNFKDLVEAEAATYFNDLDGYGWAKGYINKCYDLNWIKGIGNNMFAPGKDVTYAEAITVLIRLRMGAGNELYGPWPQAYIEYAQMYNMLGRVNVTNWNDPAKKGDIAMLVYNIVDITASNPYTGQVTIDSFALNGTVGTEVSQKFSLRLGGGESTGTDLNAGQDVTSWFSGLSGIGLKAEIATFVNRSSLYIPIVISGTPTAAYDGTLSGSVPGAMLSGKKSLSISNSGAKLIIKE